MSLIKSISGIRGTIGGLPGDNLTAIDIVSFTAAYASRIVHQTGNNKIVVGRDARISGAIVSGLVINTLRSMGCDVLDLGLSTTPTVEVAVPAEQAAGGIIITASHNPRQWNALKFLDHHGEFISAQEGQEILNLIESGTIVFASVDKLGTYQTDDTWIQKHIDMILALPLVKADLIRSKSFKVVVDCINSTGAISIVPLLEQLGCEVTVLYGDMTGDFIHNPEPLPQHLDKLSKKVTEVGAHLGIAVDPDVDRLAFVCEDGEMFGEEYTLVAVADYILKNRHGSTVSNLSSTRALKTVTEKLDGKYYTAAVGEVNVVAKMKEVNAIIGGEGNGGIIYPDLHYGRDALVGVALFLSYLAVYGRSASLLRSTYPNFVMSKTKLELDNGIDLDFIFEKLEDKYRRYTISREDGLKIDLDYGWIHLRRSNTEPIIRIYTEADSQVAADNMSSKIKHDIGEILKGHSD